MTDFELEALGSPQLLAMYRAILATLKERGIVRTANAPTGDYAEYLVATHTRGELAPNSEKSWDVRADDGTLIQVKARVSPPGSGSGTRQLSVIRTWDFDVLAVVLFDDDFSILRAVMVPAQLAREQSKFVAHVNGSRIMATDGFLSQEGATDLTEELRATAAAI